MSLRGAVLDAVCSQRNRIPLYIAIMTSMGVLLLFSILVIDPWSNPIVVIDAAIIGVTFVVLVVAYWYCTKLAMERDDTFGEAEDDAEASAESGEK